MKSALLALSMLVAAADTAVLAPDKPATVNGIEAACTGIGSDARENPLWATFPLRVEMAGQGGQYLGDVRLTLSQDDRTVVAVSCAGPWIMFRLPAGRYHVEAQTEGQTSSSSALVRAKGQSRVILRFPQLGGKTAGPEPTQAQ